MKTKLRKILSELCKDMGLTDKALDELSEIGAQGLATDASDEDIKKAADSLVPYAKLMQGEITRKTRKSNHNQTPKSDGEGGDEGEGDYAIAQAQIGYNVRHLLTVANRKHLLACDIS